MVLVRAWVKAELEGILQVGANSPPVASRRLPKKQHVQCVEVDEQHNALKINDGETMVWCFVTKPAMHKFLYDGKNPSFASLNSKTITIDDWEFSSMSELCPGFDEKKAKPNGHICILINKFCLFGGERTTTIGKPSDLGEGSRDLRAIWRALSTPRDLVRALVRGQGLTDLRDTDGVVMAAPESELEGVTWEDVEPAVMMVLTPPPSPAGERQQAEANAGTPGRRDHVPPAGGSIRSGNSGEKPGGSGGGGHRGSGAGREPSLDGMTQQSLGMDYDGDLGGGEEDFQTQAPSAGNVFSQEEMDMRPASPTPSSPPSPGMASGGGGDGGGGGGSSSSSNPGGAAEAGAAAAPAAAPAPAQERNDGVAQESLPGSQGAVPNAHDDVPVGKEAREGQVGGAQPARRGGSANGKGPAARGGGGGRQPPGSSRAEEQDEEEEEEEEESGTDPIPPGFTQLDVLHTGDGELGLSEPQPQRRGAAGSENGEPEDDDDDEDENEQIGGRRRENGAAAGSARAGRTVTAAGKGKGRVSFQRPSPPEDGEEEDGIRAASAGGSGSGGGCGAATQDSLSQDDIFSPQELSGGTSSSSNIGTPNSNQLVLSCLTQKRQNEGLCHPNSGARNAAEKCDIRSVFRAGGGGGGAGAAAAPAIRRKHGGHNERDGVPRDGIIGNNGGGGAGSSSGYDGALSAGDGGISTASTPDTIEMPVEDGLPKSSVADRVARKFPMRPLRGGSVAGGRKRSRPLSDILVAVDPAWDGQGRAPIIARGPNADKGLAEWLDSSRPEKRPAPLSIAAWLDKYAGSGGGEHGGGSSGGAGRTTCGSSRRSGDGGGGSSAGGGGSSAGGGWRR